MFPDGLTAIDAPEIGLGAESADGAEYSAADAGGEGGEGDNVSEQGDGQGAAAPGEGAQPAGGEFRAVENGKLNAAVKTALDKLKTENPQLAKAVQRALFAEDRLRRELPGGFKEIGELRARLEGLGGEEGIQELQQEMNGWREFDQLYSSGDPKVLDFLMGEPEGKEAFLRIAPMAFEKFREANPEGYAAYVSQVFVSDMMAQGIPLLVERLYDFLPADNPRAKEALDKLAGYLNRVNGFAQKQVGAAAPAKSGQPDPRAQDLERREQSLTRTEWRGEADKRHGAMFAREWKTQIGDRKPTDTQLATIKELYGLKLGAILKARADFNGNLERYFGSKQKDGFLRYFESVYREAVPRALRTAIQQVLPAKPGPRGGQQQQQPKPGTEKPGQKPAPATGFTLVNAKPAMGTVDRTATSPDMWLAGKAVLKDGKRVQWRTP